ncbi:hypothetical protein Glove_230g207 [Diversispora epigaea]|uniref:BACK domain-containing protein n=1 Tax=Diversispora epigaea TaxID=1348612 RepID=A0A397IKR0_9GLOM|nr:hypothetical protein Glove_230g207 [Diversispora epigaea]
MPFKFSEKLSQDFSELLNDKEEYNVIIEVENMDTRTIEDLMANWKKFCNDIIVKHPSIIFESAEFTSLHESALISILKRDDLQMKESEIWDYVIKWGTAHNPTLPEKLERKHYDFKNNSTTMFTTFRYFDISNSDFKDKIKPYEKILDDFEQHLMLPINQWNPLPFHQD